MDVPVTTVLLVCGLLLARGDFHGLPACIPGDRRFFTGVAGAASGKILARDNLSGCTLLHVGVL